MTRTKLTSLAIDFDGVIHDYKKGWHDGSIYGEPIKGSLEALEELSEMRPVFIHTARDPQQVTLWLQRRGICATSDDSCEPCRGFKNPTKNCRVCQGTGVLKFWNSLDLILVTNRKLAAAAYLDDRGIRFTDWETALIDLERWS